MKKICILLISLIMMFSLSSCETYTYTTTQDDIYVETEVDMVRSNVSFDIIINNGIPYFMNGKILYYFYKGIYYYPFYYNNYWYVRAYRRPFPHLNYKPYFRPHRYDHRFRPGHYRGYDIPYYRHRNHHINKSTHQNNRHIQYQRYQRNMGNQNNYHRGIKHNRRK